MRLNFVERDDGHPLLELAIVEQLAGDLLVLHDDVIQLPSGANLESGGLLKVGFVQRNERCYEALDFASVEVGRRIRVRKVQSCDCVL